MAQVSYCQPMSETESTEPPPIESAPAPERYVSTAALTVASLWAALAVIFALVLLVNAQDESYGGDAFTGIQNSVNWAVRGIAFMLFGSGALGIVIAVRRDRH